MKLTFRMTVGFPVASVDYGCEIDTEALAEDDARTLQTLMKRVDLADVCRKAAKGGADAPQYELTVTGREGEQHVRFSELDLSQGSGELAALVDFLSQRARLIPRA